MIVGGKLVRGLSYMLLEHIRMDFNHAYGENEDGSVVVSFAMKHAIVRVLVASLRAKMDRNILEVLAELMQDPIEGRDGSKEGIHCN